MFRVDLNTRFSELEWLRPIPRGPNSRNVKPRVQISPELGLGLACFRISLLETVNNTALLTNGFEPPGHQLGNMFDFDLLQDRDTALDLWKLGDL